MATKKSTAFKIDTTPSKKVIVESLTRDISIDACVFDLIDNAVDAARNSIFSKRRDSGNVAELPISYKGYEIKIQFSAETFSIQDNCGGISITDLKTSVLRFGERSAHQLGIGVFGVGLNRALFKIGHISEIFTDTGTERAELSLDTEKYLKAAGWALPAVEAPSTGKASTTIKISGLSTETARRFADKNEIENLGNEIGRIYSRFIEKGLKILVNRRAVESHAIEIRENGPYASDRKLYKTEDGISIFLHAGQHSKHRFVAEPDYDKEINSQITNEFGWTIFCNDRAVVSHDRSAKTGWFAKFHSEFYGFVGEVNFVGDPAKLPWTTTKEDVDLNNRAYQTALDDMRRFAENWRSNATDAKKKKKQHIPLNPPPSPPKGKPVKKELPASNPKPTIKKKVVEKIDHHQVATILPADIDEKHCNDKHLALVHEAKQLVLGNFVYSGLVLMRILFETTVVTYLIRHNAFDAFSEAIKIEREKEKKHSAPSANSSILPSLDEALTYLSKNPDVFGAGKDQYLKHSLTRMQHHKKMLNSAAHNAYQPINRSEALQIRDEILPILRHLIEH
ncbi:ATP-binding protein [Paraburkholderia sp. BL25I1N1]|uniref:ATP-binding protein n=1 Tax=Paraburkholderia sp. BL25I1N1 TaxID=1938804 RepID=UPI000D04EC8C|nr:ATP-binding protein [Paraburkholderia sp. BL25I1N1]PRY03199.1 histidine kinase/DNA gyrase B/HSP90-like ATPase [Paraburkholderia sp. BL25I1N1]